MCSRREEKTAIKRGPGGNKTGTDTDWACRAAGIGAGQSQSTKSSLAPQGLFDLCSDAASAPKRRLIIARR